VLLACSVLDCEIVRRASSVAVRRLYGGGEPRANFARALEAVRAPFVLRPDRDLVTVSLMSDLLKPTVGDAVDVAEFGTALPAA